MPEIVPIPRDIPLVDVDNDGTATVVMEAWMTLVQRLPTIFGTGSPEGVVSAPKGREYFDENTNTKYIKKSAGIAGDPKTGWVAL